MGKVYNLCKMKTEISTVLMVKSGLDPHMIIELEDNLNRCYLFMLFCFALLQLFTYLWVNGINLYLVNACQLKFDQLKVLIAVKPCQLFLDLALHVV